MFACPVGLGFSGSRCQVSTSALTSLMDYSLIIPLHCPEALHVGNGLAWHKGWRLDAG